MTKKQFDKEVAERIKEELKFRHYVYKQVAPAIGMSLSLFSNKIACKGGCFSFFDICKIAKFLKINIHDLVGEDYEEN